VYNKTILDNGVRIVTEKVPYVKSVSVGIWVNVGSRDEDESEGGLSHFVEHMLFKGTSRRDALQIAKEIDQIGGMANAFTGKEYTCFHARVMSDHLFLITDLLTDIFLSSVFNPEDIDRERQVILQEINMVEDTPDEFIHLLFGQNFWPGAALGRSVLGTVETVGQASRETLLRYIKKHYLPTKIVIAAAGDLEHQAFVDLISPAFNALPIQQDELVRQSPQDTPGLNVVQKDLEQVHFCLGAPFPSAIDDRRFAAAVFSTLLGGNMSSRLFQEIREMRGLAYSIFSFLSNYADAGVLGIYAGVGRGMEAETINLISIELQKLKSGEMREAEIEAAKEYLKGGLVLSLESTDNLMNRLAKNELLFNRFIEYEEVLKRIEEVTGDQLVGLARDFIQSDLLSLTVLGPTAENNFQSDPWPGLPPNA